MVGVFSIHVYIKNESLFTMTSGIIVYIVVLGIPRNLADVDKDGKLKADEFILAMHLIDMAKEGQALPLALPLELVPPSLRYSKTVN